MPSPTTKTAAERRSRVGIELRKASDGKPAGLRGYAAVWDKPSEDLGGWVEVIRKGAFTRSLAAGGDVLALAYHDDDAPLARLSAGTLTLTEDDTGLLVDMTLCDTTTARDVLADVEARNITGMSFGFCVCRTMGTCGDRWTPGGQGQPDLRELLDVDLFEVSVTTMPAYPDTTIATRSRPDAASINADHARMDALRLRLISV